MHLDTPRALAGLSRAALLAMALALTTAAPAAPVTFAAHAYDLGEAGRSCAADHQSGSTPQTAVCSGPPGELGKARSFLGGVGVYAELFGNTSLHSGAVAAEGLFQDLWTLPGPAHLVTANFIFAFDGTRNGGGGGASLDLHPLVGGGGASPGYCEILISGPFSTCSTSVVFNSLSGMELTLRALVSVQPSVLNPTAQVIADYYSTAHLISVSLSDASGAVSLADLVTGSGGIVTATGYATAPAQVPEPATALLAFSALGALSMRRLRRR